MNQQEAEKALGQFFASAPLQTYKKKDIIVRLDEEYQDVYWIEAGFVKVASYAPNGSEIILHIYKAGEIFPLAKLVQSQYPQHIFFAAYRDGTVVRRAARKSLMQYLEKRPPAMWAIINQQSLITDRLINMSLESAEMKVVHRILALVERYGVQEGNHYRVTLPFTQQEFADGINISRETTGRLLNRLESRNLLLRGRTYTIVYADKLDELRAMLE